MAEPTSQLRPGGGPAVELVPASELTLGALAELFNAAYADYFVPLHVDEALLGSIVRSWDIDLARSRVAVLDGQPVGLANLGVRGDVGWIGGMGVVPERRRSGIGRLLLEAVLGEAPGEVWLEVIEQNEAAIRLYEKLGFETVRRLDVWSWSGEPQSSGAREAEPRLVQDDAPWQSARPALDALSLLETDGGAILFRAADRVDVVQVSALDEHAATELLASARARGSSLRYTNAPSDSPAAASLRRLGATLELRQLEMRRPAALSRR